MNYVLDLLRRYYDTQLHFIALQNQTGIDNNCGVSFFFVSVLCTFITLLKYDYGRQLATDHIIKMFYLDRK